MSLDRARRIAKLTIPIVAALILVVFAVRAESPIDQPIVEFLESRAATSPFLRRMIKPNDDLASSVRDYVRMVRGGLAWLVPLVPLAWIAARSALRPRSRVGDFGLFAIIAAAGAVAVLSGPQHDYHAFLLMWRDVEAGADPWAASHGGAGNNYGPAFNAIALAAMLHPMLPKLLFCAAWLGIAVIAIRRFDADADPDLSDSERPGTAGPRARMALALLFELNPYFWIEVPLCGHFDVLCAFCCLAALNARIANRDLCCGAWLGLGFLIKFSPVVLIPYLMLDRGPLRWRIALGAAITAGSGMALGMAIWGDALFSPFLKLAEAGPSLMSIFRVLGPRWEWLSAPMVVASALAIWTFCRRNAVDPTTSAVLGYFVFLMFSKFGYPQYFLPMLAILAYWSAARWQALIHDRLLAFALTAYVGFISVYSVIYFVDFLLGYPWSGLRRMIGAPTFAVSCLALRALLRLRVCPRRSRFKNSSPL